MARLMAPQEGDEICDPTCGSGSLVDEMRSPYPREHRFTQITPSTGKKPSVALGRWPR